MKESTATNAMDARSIGRPRGGFYQEECSVNDLDALRYPVGRFERLIAPLDRAARDGHLGTLEQTPARLRSLVSGRSNAQLDATYRPGGWTVRQVVHHVA